MSVTITIKMASLLSDVMVKSHLNTARVKDPEEQYAVRAGEENGSEIRQSLQDAWRGLVSLCRPFLTMTDDTAGNDLLSSTIATADQTLTFDVTERRTSNFADQLAEEMHQYLVNGTLRRFYTAVMMPDLVTICAAAENAARDNIYRIMYRKLEPVWEEDQPQQTQEP